METPIFTNLNSRHLGLVAILGTHDYGNPHMILGDLPKNRVFFMSVEDWQRSFGEWQPHSRPAWWDALPRPTAPRRRERLRGHCACRRGARAVQWSSWNMGKFTGNDHEIRSSSRNWLVVWLPSNFYFPRNIGNNHPNSLSYFSEGWPNHQPGKIWV